MVVAEIFTAALREIRTAILTIIERHQVILSLIRSVSPVVGDSRVIESKEELLEMVAQSSGAISPSEKKLITNGLKFNDMKVEEV